MKKIIILISTILLLAMLCTTVFAESSDVAGVVEETWNEARTQIQKVVNNVVFPIIDVVLAILFFIKIAMSYMEYRKHGQFDFTAPAILFVSLIFALTAPLYLWKII